MVQDGGMVETYGDHRDALRDRRNAVLSHHHWFSRELPRLESVAWQGARALTSRETMAMIHALNVFRDELRRHCTFAAALVYPFVGEARGSRFLREHLDGQRAVERAAQSAVEHAKGDLAVELGVLVPRLAQFFEAERDLIIVPLAAAT
jgi:hypothetical protein